MDKIIIGTLSLLVIIVVGIIFSSSIRKAIILSGVLSILASFSYILLLAPDVALAEAVIGCTLSTIILMMAIQYLEVVHIVYTIEAIPYSEFAKVFSNVYVKEKYDVHFTANKENPELNLYRYAHLDYFVVEKMEKIFIFSRLEDKKVQLVIEGIENITDKPVEFINETRISPFGL